MPYIYSFWQIFQTLCLFPALHLHISEFRVHRLGKYWRSNKFTIDPCTTVLSRFSRYDRDGGNWDGRGALKVSSDQLTLFQGGGKLCSHHYYWLHQFFDLPLSLNFVQCTPFIYLIFEDRYTYVYTVFPHIVFSLEYFSTLVRKIFKFSLKIGEKIMRKLYKFFRVLPFKKRIVAVATTYMRK